VGTLEAGAETLEQRDGCFQIFTFSITMDEDMNPWLLKVGTGSFPPEKNLWISDMLDSMAEGVLKIVLDTPATDAPTPLYSYTDYS
jgi:hypothetical protein